MNCRDASKKRLASKIPVRKGSLEKAEAFFQTLFFASALNQFPIARRGKVGKRTAVEHGAWIFFEERGGKFLASCFGEQIESGFEAQRTRVEIVRVAGNEMNRVGVEQEFRGFLGAATESAGERLRGDLDEAALAEPSPEAFPLGTDQGVAFRMSDDGLKAH